MCEECARKHVESYRARVALGLCQCGKKAEAGHRRCRRCNEQQSKRQKAANDKRRQNGLCIGCGNQTRTGRSYCQTCLSAHKQQRDYRKANGLCRSCGVPVSVKSRCEKCAETNRASRTRLKMQVFNAYGGPVCACCGEKRVEFLSVDHIHNDGAVHRRIIGPSKLYRHLRKHGYPPGYQILCMNCNFAKSRFGMCPHEKEAGRDSSQTQGGIANSHAKMAS